MSKKAKRVFQPEALSEDTQKFYDVLNDEPDHSVIIVGAAYLDACIGAMLAKFLIDGSSTVDKLLNPQGGAIGTFSARNDMCYALGLISETMHSDLSVVAEIRNQCAHHHLLKTFADDGIASACQKLSFAGSLLRWDGEEGPMIAPQHLADTKMRFTLNVVLMSQRILLDSLGIKHRQRRQPIKTTSDKLGDSSGG